MSPLKDTTRKMTYKKEGTSSMNSLVFFLEHTLYGLIDQELEEQQQEGEEEFMLPQT